MQQAKKFTLMISLIVALSLSISPHAALATQSLPEDQVTETRNEDDANNTKMMLGSSHTRPDSGINSKANKLKQIIDSAKTVYNLAKVENWTEAKAHIASLQTTASRLKENDGFSREEFAQLRSLITPLHDSVIAKIHHQAMYDANQLAMTTTQLIMRSESQIPIGVAMLDYYSRELEIWSECGNTAKLRTVADQIQQAWTTLRPEVQTRTASNQVQKFDDTLVALIQTATSPVEYGRLATPLLAEVNHLQHLFQLPA